MIDVHAKERSREAEQLRSEIERTREQVAASATALESEIAEAADWRRWFRRRPWLFLGGAFALGFWLGKRRRPARFHMQGG